MQQNWSNGILYAFPPFCLLGQVLHKVLLDQTQKMLLITPAWRTQPWYPQLLRILISNPYSFSKKRSYSLGKQYSLV